jgi:hypothetical protein
MFIIEEESGTFSGTVHPHNGYYAGDFSHTPVRTPSAPAVPGWHVSLEPRHRPGHHVDHRR